MPERRTTTRMGMVCALLAVSILLGTQLSACKDERGSINDPTTPGLGGGVGVDSDFLFGSTVISAGILRFQNTVIDTLVRYVASGEPFPYEILADVGTGKMTFLGETQGVHNVVLDAYNDFDVDQLLSLISGSMRIRLDEISPGLRYTINPGEEDVTLPQPSFVLYQLPTEFGDGARLRVSGSVTGIAEGSAARHAGYVHQTGKIRIDETTQGFLLVESLAVEYPYDPLITPSFDSRWPLGGYEVGIFLQGANPPLNITFDGNGGATFPYRGGTCNVNLEDLEFGNPCLGT